jgi:uncharacterized protein (TIGR02117 family)
MSPARFLRSTLLAGGLLAFGCTIPVPAPTARAAPTVATIHIVSHGWHAGLVVRRSDIPPGAWPEKRDFPDAEFLEIGWGDRDYYRAREPGAGALFKAAFWPTESVLHVVGFRGPVAANFPHSDVLALSVTRDGLARLIDFIDAAHERRGEQPLDALGPGLYGDSRYYAARGRFHLFNNCNRWTARALRAAGYDIDEVLTADGLFTELQRAPSIP